ncbi:hypothetical protein N7539_007246 [Penicillium diatomitis]|uniref:Zn(2)-C6 fungal-type domain-containing protein n=1 Tax=Penicillium diatomitis TaxID=2819901 RepID=A0A9W9WUW3_9EURO|nr:uncharacterized protein N7539_007246 [Penicillium diatomitis]KAJ5477102.1 hypothetical protein N7539_007246 [Penicillium diatomitis]
MSEVKSMSEAKRPSMFLSGRAQKACQSCQTAKVRCNAALGTPCHNCTRKGIQCIVKRRNQASRFMSTSPPISQSTPGVAQRPSPRISSPSSSTGPTSDRTMHHSLRAFNEEDFWQAFTNLGASTLRTLCDIGPLQSLPGFLDPLPPHMSRNSIESLRMNGVFDLPSERLKHALLETFFESVLPSMPILEWQDFLRSIHDESGSQGTVSLLLYSAVMFSATTFVHVDHLLEAGYNSRKEAHEAFFQRTKMLYKSNYESDPITIIQTLLLMTLRLDTADGHDSRHWVKAAITVSRSIGLFHELFLTPNVGYSPKLWKRIAWACYMVDSIIALRLRCRTAIDQAEFSHLPLAEQDFEVSDISPSLDTPTDFPGGCTLVRNVQAQLDLAKICISTARLCICIHSILDLQGKQSMCAVPSPMSPTGTTGIDMTTPTTLDNYTRQICSLVQTDLADWANTLPPPCQAQPQFPSLGPHSPTTNNTDKDDLTVVLHRNILHMIFYTTIAVFHQSQPFLSSQSCVQLAASQISRITSELYQLNLQHRLPVIGVTAILVALIIHVSDMKKASSSSSQQHEAILNFRLCLDVMGSLRDLYCEANTATRWALSVIRNLAFNTDCLVEVPGPDECRFRERSSSSSSDSVGRESIGVSLLSDMDELGMSDSQFDLFSAMLE